jgi:hypothetical protein
LEDFELTQNPEAENGIKFAMSLSQLESSGVLRDSRRAQKALEGKPVQWHLAGFHSGPLSNDESEVWAAAADQRIRYVAATGLHWTSLTGSIEKFRSR